MAKDMVRRISPGGVFLGHWTAREARDKIFHKKATVRHATRQRITAVTDLEARVDASIPGAALRTFQREQLSNTLSVRVLKRAVGTRESPGYVSWDGGLTFRELHEGAITSQATRDARNAARQLKFVENAALNKYNRREASRR